MYSPEGDKIIDCLGNPNSSRCPQMSNSQTTQLIGTSSVDVNTYNFEFRSYKRDQHLLPGEIPVNTHCIDQCVIAHNNVIRVAKFIQEVLSYEPLNGTIVNYTSSINCVQQSGEVEWRNAAWLDQYEQAIFGQYKCERGLQTCAVCPDLVAHEFFHGLNYQIAGFEYYGQSGALDESYADIFSILVTNFANSDIGTWDWEIGSGVGVNGRGIRNLSVPSRYNQPEHMANYSSSLEDHGGVHFNSGIHNKAAYNLLTSRDNHRNYLFDGISGAKLFYLSLMQLSKQSVFSDSRRAMQQVARTLFRQDSDKVEKFRAIATAFDNVGIGDNVGIFE